VDAFRSILLPVPEVEALVDPYRREGDWSHRHGVPAHQTLAGPFPPGTPLPHAALGELSAAMRGTRYDLDSVGMLGDALSLFPADDAALLRWRKRALDLIGEPDRVDDGWRMHLTVCRLGSSTTESDKIAHALAPSLPVTCEVANLLVAEHDRAGQVSVRPLGS
jgi:hypothetical protein